MTLYYTFSLITLKDFMPDVLQVIVKYVAVCAAPRWKVGDCLDVLDLESKWCAARVVKYSTTGDKVFIRYGRWYVRMLLG